MLSFTIFLKKKNRTERSVFSILAGLHSAFCFRLSLRVILTKVNPAEKEPVFMTRLYLVDDELPQSMQDVVSTHMLYRLSSTTSHILLIFLGVIEKKF